MEKKPNFSGPRKPGGNNRPGQRGGARGKNDKDPYAINEQIRAREVCRILDYPKFLDQQKKRLKEQKQKATKVVVKEIRFGPQTDDHDYNFKLKHARGFLQEGSKVKAYVFFRGRSILFKEQGEVLLLRFANDLEDLGKVEQMPVLEGKRMIIMITPLKTQPKKDAPKKDAAPKAAPKKETPESETAGEDNNEA